jgi:NAD(P)H-dependent flavin oxidoreductase YrpB (nitropropane dioxygenase family)
MNVAAGPELAAAVTNAGGLGVIGGTGYTPKILRQQASSVSVCMKRLNVLNHDFSDPSYQKGFKG